MSLSLGLSLLQVLQVEQVGLLVGDTVLSLFESQLLGGESLLLLRLALLLLLLHVSGFARMAA